MHAEPDVDDDHRTLPASPPGATLDVVRADDLLTYVALKGSLDISAVERVSLAFNANVTARQRATIVDLAGLSFISSLGLSLLVSAHRAAKLRDRPFIIVAPQPAVLDVLTSARLHQVMPIVADLDQALALVGAPPPR